MTTTEGKGAGKACCGKPARCQEPWEPCPFRDAAPAPAEGEVVGWQVRITNRPDEWAACTKELHDVVKATGRYFGTPESPTAESRALYTHPTPPPAAAQAFSAANPSSVNDLPAATDIGVGSTPAAAHREVGEVVAYVEAYIDGYDQRCRGLVWADHPANTPGRTFEPLVQASALAAERERAERLEAAVRLRDACIREMEIGREQFEDRAEARIVALEGGLREIRNHTSVTSEQIARIDALLEPGDGG